MFAQRQVGVAVFLQPAYFNFKIINWSWDFKLQIGCIKTWAAKESINARLPSRKLTVLFQEIIAFKGFDALIINYGFLANVKSNRF